jgi:hypothetical protein
MIDFNRFIARVFWVCVLATAAIPGYAGLLGTEVTVAFSTIISTPTQNSGVAFGPQNFLVGTENLNCPVFGANGSLCSQFLPVPYSINFTDAQIQYSATGGVGRSFLQANFNGWQFTNLNMGTSITGVSFAANGFDPLPIVTFTANSVSVNVEGCLISTSSGFTITLLTANAVEVSPSGPISFTQAQGGPAPQAQSLTLTSSSMGASYSAYVGPVTGGNWLQINSGSSAAGTIDSPQMVSVSVNPTVADALPPAQYRSMINFAFEGASTLGTTVTASLTIAPIAPTVSVSPASLTLRIAAKL